jgi:hypothetical protein
MVKSTPRAADSVVIVGIDPVELAMPGARSELRPAAAPMREFPCFEASTAPRRGSNSFTR